MGATARIARSAAATEVTRIKRELSDAGFSAMTVEDQLSAQAP